MSPSSPREGAPGSVDGPGLLHEDDERAIVTFQRLLHHPIEEVWAAITDPEELETWSLVKVSREPSHGRLEMRYANGLRAGGRVLEWNPPRVYEYEWNVDPGQALPRGETSIVRWELSPRNEGTLLVVTHRKLTRPTAEVLVRGLRVFLDRLSAHMDGRPIPEPPWNAPPPIPSREPS
ncbi:MAG: SRPBCC domain-containing protein [Thermoplasmata archaeon]